MGEDAILFATEKTVEQFDNIKLEVIGHAVSSMETSLGKNIAKLPYGRTLLYMAHTRKMLKQLDTIDALILGGGGLLCDREKRDVSNDVKLLRKMQEREKPTMIYAVGVPWLWRERSKKSIKQVVEKAKYISCRDPTSTKKIKELNVSVPVHTTGDPSVKIPSFLDLNPRVKDLDKQNINICISLRRTEGNNKLIAEAIAEVTKYLMKKYVAKIKFIPMRTRWNNDDTVLHERVRKILGTSSDVTFIDKRPSVTEFVNELANTTLIIGVPLHSVVLSASMYVPSLAICYTPDVTSFMEYIGMEEFTISLPESTNSQVLIEKIEQIFDSYTNLNKRLLQSIVMIKQKSEQDERAISHICEGLTDNV